MYSYISRISLQKVNVSMKKFWDTQAIRASYRRINYSNLHRSRTSRLRSFPWKSEIWNFRRLSVTEWYT